MGGFPEVDERHAPRMRVVWPACLDLSIARGQWRARRPWRVLRTRRDAYLTREGYRVMRFWNTDVLTNREGVLLTILEALE
jgi:hypothetical protein